MIKAHAWCFSTNFMHSFARALVGIMNWWLCKIKNSVIWWKPLQIVWWLETKHYSLKEMPILLFTIPKLMVKLLAGWVGFCHPTLLIQCNCLYLKVKILLFLCLRLRIETKQHISNDNLFSSVIIGREC